MDPMHGFTDDKTQLWNTAKGEFEHVQIILSCGTKTE
jgi:hypothetical protein